MNIGGISNISVLRPNQPTLGYDTGPGNMLMDAWVDKHIGEKFDRDAQFALKGQLNQALLEQLSEANLIYLNCHRKALAESCLIYRG